MAKARLRLENLSARDLPSASFLNGILTIDGTEGRDVIVVRQQRDEIRVHGQEILVDGQLVKSIPASEVTQIEVNAFGGNDRIVLNSLKMPTSVDAGAGNDFVFGGQSDDTIAGGAGNDVILSSKGSDDVSGDDGDDNLNGGLGDDSIDGGTGDDRGVGHSGNDDLSGDAGDDSLSGGGGDDSIRGEDGDDRINGNSGDDDCDGGTGDDDCRGGGGHDDVRDDAEGLTEVEGVITAIDLSSSTVSIQTRSGVLIAVTVAGTTSIERNDAHVTLADFQIGDFAEAKFDAQGTTIEIEAMTADNEGGTSGSDGRQRVEGLITAIDLANNKVTIRTWSGQSVEVAVAPTTKIERNDLHVTLAAFKVGDRGEARFDASGFTLKIEAEGV